MKRTTQRARLLLLLALLTALAGCSLLEIKSQTERLQVAATLQGEVRGPAERNGPLNVLIFEIVHGTPIYEGAAYADEAGRYRFHVTPGTYLISAHIDVNRDGSYQRGEPVAKLPPGQFQTVSPGQALDAPVLEISTDANAALSLDASVRASAFHENIGKVTSLDAPIFSPDNYAMGLWRPFDFMGTVGGGLFLLEPYDEGKIPVLFVHGINGGPTDWQTTIASLDTKRFQPWVFYYASGLQLDIVSDSLLQSVVELQKRHRYQRLIVAAHSMGGLVTRDFVRKCQAQHPHHQKMLKLVMTVNSPLGGMRSAATGVKASPIVVQSWKDVAQGSEFINKLTEWPWPEDIPYHLVFSHADGKAHDGVVALAEQIPRPIQKNATRMHGFVNSHTGTLHDPQFIELFNALLAGAAGRP